MTDPHASPFHFAVFPRLHLTGVGALDTMHNHWEQAIAAPSAEATAALAKFRAQLADPAFAKTHAELTGKTAALLDKIASHPVVDGETIGTHLASLSQIVHKKIGSALARLREVHPHLPEGALRHDIEAILALAETPGWKASQEKLDAAVGTIRQAIADSPFYKKAHGEMKESLAAIGKVQKIFSDVDHGNLEDFPWLVTLRNENPALFDRVINAADPGHIHIRPVGLNDPAFAMELLARANGTYHHVIAAPAAMSAASAEALAAPELDAATLSRVCTGESPAELALRDMRKLGVIAAIAGAVVAGAVILNRRAAHHTPSSTVSTDGSRQEKPILFESPSLSPA